MLIGETPPTRKVIKSRGWLHALRRLDGYRLDFVAAPHPCTDYCRPTRFATRPQRFGDHPVDRALRRLCDDSNRRSLRCPSIHNGLRCQGSPARLQCGPIPWACT
ncbi:Hypothetical protein DIP0735 [Corynebacterium diphtheriae]|uniref:Uncharacterized protein n=1 Tax=Corynebacterium diphtheriae (strain ATCC 700971 / NCTC 13129 / Biotype gravis) TaxID=257309 RepID=Q6NIN3_CORDI|nr:Hypothetical protein DIP0735 [Corynebacterium diphtheriae]